MCPPQSNFFNMYHLRAHAFTDLSYFLTLQETSLHGQRDELGEKEKLRFGCLSLRARGKRASRLIAFNFYVSGDNLMKGLRVFKKKGKRNTVAQHRACKVIDGITIYWCWKQA